VAWYDIPLRHCKIQCIPHETKPLTLLELISSTGYAPIQVMHLYLGLETELLESLHDFWCTFYCKITTPQQKDNIYTSKTRNHLDLFDLRVLSLSDNFDRIKSENLTSCEWPNSGTHHPRSCQILDHISTSGRSN
jgi:hypothetical protein